MNPHSLSSRRPSGFTLVEMLVTLAIVSVLMAGVAGVVIGQSNAFELSTRTREAIASNRSSIALLERSLRMAGWGVDPALAFDFGTAAQPLTRDRANGPDELSFYSRDPRFNRRATSLGGTSLTLDAPLQRTLYPGQILQVICPSGVGSAYSTVSARVDSGQLTISLRAGTGTFPTQILPTCSDLAFVVKVDRHRFFLANVNDGGATPRSYLMLDQGLELVPGRPFDAARNRYQEIPGDLSATLTAAQLQNLTPVAAGVEDFQVAYEMNRPDPTWAINPAPVAADSDGNWIFGDSAVEQPNSTATQASYDDGYLDPKRFTAHPSNIRSVRVSLVTRSDKDLNRQNARPKLENHPAATSKDGHQREVITTNIFIRNMLSRSEFAPVQVGGGS